MEKAKRAKAGDIFKSTGAYGIDFGKLREAGNIAWKELEYLSKERRRYHQERVRSLSLAY